MNAIGMTGARIPNSATVRRTSAAILPPRSPNGSCRLPRNCSASTTYQKPSHVSGMTVDERGPEGSGPERQLEVDERDGRDQRDHAGEDQARPPDDARVDRQHVQADRDGQEERQRVVADREPEDDRRARPASGPRAARSRTTTGRRRGRGRPSRRAAGAGSRRASGGGRAGRRACRSTRRCGVRARREAGGDPDGDASASAPGPGRPSPRRRPRGRPPRAGSCGTPRRRTAGTRTEASQPSRT